MDRVTGSTVTEEVSCELWLDTSFEPERQFGIQVNPPPSCLCAENHLPHQ